MAHNVTIPLLYPSFTRNSGELLCANIPNIDLFAALSLLDPKANTPIYHVEIGVPGRGQDGRERSMMVYTVLD